MPTHSRLFTNFSTHAYPTTPPISIAQIDELEKALIRKEIKHALTRKVEDIAAFRGVRDKRHGFGHLWTRWEVSLGVTYWPDIGRVYRKCIALGHWKRHYPCVNRPRFMTRRLEPAQLVELNEMRALYDVLGDKKWSLTSNPGGGPADAERARWIRIMWRERECPTLETLGAVFWRLLDEPTDEEQQSTGWETDSDGESASWIIAEPDSNDELKRFKHTESEVEVESEDEASEVDELTLSVDEEDSKDTIVVMDS